MYSISLLQSQPSEPTGRRLRDIIEEKFSDGGIIIGSAHSTLHFDDTAGIIVNREVNYVTSESVFKQSHIHPDNSTWDWTNADRWIKQIADNNQILRVHGPVGPQCSRWAKDDARTAEELDTNMRDFFKSLCKRYNGLPGFRYMDVVNETIVSGKWHTDKPGTDWECPWYKIGQDNDPYQTPLYIKTAFEIATKNAPDFKLIYNQHTNPQDTASWELIKQTIVYLRSQGLRVDGIGWQAHVDVGWETPDNLQYLKNLIDWAHNNSLEFHITEFGVYLKTGSGETYRYLGYNQSSLQRQAETYRTVVQVLLNKRSTGKVGWNTWNVSDKYGWQHGQFPDRLYPYMFDTAFIAKPAYYEVQKVLENVD